MRGLYRAGQSAEDVQALFKLIDWILALSPKLKDMFQTEVRKIEKETGMPYITSIERWGREDGLKEGLEQGLNQGRREAIFDTLEARFGQVPDSIRSKLEELSKLERLRELGRLAVTVESLEEYQRHLSAPE